MKLNLSSFIIAKFELHADVTHSITFLEVSSSSEELRHISSCCLLIFEAPPSASSRPKCHQRFPRFPCSFGNVRCRRLKIVENSPFRAYIMYDVPPPIHSTYIRSLFHEEILSKLVVRTYLLTYTNRTVRVYRTASILRI